MSSNEHFLILTILVGAIICLMNIVLFVLSYKTEHTEKELKDKIEKNSRRINHIEQRGDNVFTELD